MTASLKEYDTSFPADAVEFCPHSLAQDLLVCGTYNLLEERDRTGKQQRIGRCSFLAVSTGGDLCGSLE
jgi:diphthamide biosynthesis protein 7